MSIRHALIGALAALAAAPALAQAPSPLQVRSWAATCANCHGTDGRAVPGEANTRLAGMQKDLMLMHLNAFRSGQRPATVMHQLVKGYTPEQLDAIATYFSQQR